MTAVTITYSEPATRFQMPTKKQCLALLAIVEAAHPTWAKLDVDEFALAMIAVGGMWRIDAPSTQYSLSHFLDRANETLQARQMRAINAPALLAAVVAQNDVLWRAYDRRVGQPTELALDIYSGRPCSVPNGWRRVLEGQPLKPPLAARKFLVDQAAPSSVRYYQEGYDGRMREVGPDVDMFRR
jgi:hypothetical protein